MAPAHITAFGASGLPVEFTSGKRASAQRIFTAYLMAQRCPNFRPLDGYLRVESERNAYRALPSAITPILSPLRTARFDAETGGGYSIVLRLGFASPFANVFRLNMERNGSHDFSSPAVPLVSAVCRLSSGAI